MWRLELALGAFVTSAVFTCPARAEHQAASQTPNAKAPGKKGGEVPARVDERVELLSIIFRLLQTPEYSRAPQDVAYVKEVDAHFTPYRNHEAIKLAARLRAWRGISYDAVASFAVHIKGGPRLEPKILFADKALELERRWSPESATEFLAAVQKFADDSKAFEFFKRHEDFYARAADRLANEVAKRPYRAWLDGFFGAKPGAEFCAIVGLLNGTNNYGVKFRYPKGHEEILPIIGANRFDRDGLPVFTADHAGTVAHEFCHSYCNPLVDRFADKLTSAANKIYPRRAAMMREQAYGTPRTMLYESLVRACTHRFLVAHGTPQEAAASLRGEVRRGFFWTPELSALLNDYEKSRDQNATLDQFMPRVVEFFDSLAGKLDAELARLPRVTKIVPADGAKDVDPDLAELRIEFDRPMNPKGRALMGKKDELPVFTGTGRFSDDGKVFTTPIKLEAGRTYKLSINSIWNAGFTSADGLPLDPVQVTFTTSKR